MSDCHRADARGHVLPFAPKSVWASLRSTHPTKLMTWWPQRQMKRTIVFLALGIVMQAIGHALSYDFEKLPKLLRYPSPAALHPYTYWPLLL